MTLFTCCNSAVYHDFNSKLVLSWSLIISIIIIHIIQLGYSVDVRLKTSVTS